VRRVKTDKTEEKKLR